ncbi:hypothetical protein [Muribaculum intestinale]|uniref:hypothetical protein n=1 Tax=Muribaculum intestinale TaxID=1796646 RepID=UPI00242DD6D0|nr:hypothetical protein [Muribaculum intestinale]
MIKHILTAIAAIIGVSLAFNENPHISPLWNLLGLLLLAAAYTTAFRRPNHRPQKRHKEEQPQPLRHIHHQLHSQLESQQHYQQSI